MYKAAKSYLSASRRPLLITHLAPDGDAIGSLLAMMWLLRAIGKEAIAACQDEVPASFSFLPGWELVVKEAGDQPVDLIISLDASDMERLGTVYQPELHDRLPLINIDHHVTNLYFGTVNLVDSQAVSTTQVLFNLAQNMGWPIDRSIAQCLLTGLVTDTLGFRTPNVDAGVLGLAKTLMETGASLAAITTNVLSRRSLASICLWSKALSNVKLEDHIIWTAIPLSMRAECHDAAQSDTGLVNFLLEAEEADVSVIFTEREDGRVDVGMRAVPGVDVARVALSLGGGGHAQAAGCSLQTTLAEAQKRVLTALKASLARQRNGSG